MGQWEKALTITRYSEVCDCIARRRLNKSWLIDMLTGRFRLRLDISRLSSISLGRRRRYFRHSSLLLLRRRIASTISGPRYITVRRSLWRRIPANTLSCSITTIVAMWVIPIWMISPRRVFQAERNTYARSAHYQVTDSRPYPQTGFSRTEISALARIRHYAPTIVEGWERKGWGFTRDML